MTKRKKACLILLLIALAVWGILQSPPVRSAQERARRVTCHANMMQLGRVLLHYSTDHQGAFPPSLQSLGPEYLEYPGWLVCPTAQRKAKVIGDKQTRTDYFYVSGLNERDRPDIALIVENPDNHDGGGGDVLFAGGYPRWVTSDVLQALVREPWAQCTRKSQYKRGVSDEESLELQKRIRVITN